MHSKTEYVEARPHPADHVITALPDICTVPTAERDLLCNRISKNIQTRLIIVFGAVPMLEKFQPAQGTTSMRQTLKHCF